MNKFVLILFLAISSSAFASTLTVSYPNGLWISLNSHCLENGYIRPKNPIHYKCRKTGRDNDTCRPQEMERTFLKHPLLTVERIDLGRNRFFTKATIFKVKGVNLFDETQSFIPRCHDDLIKEENPVLVERKAKAQEKIVYGALWRDGITIIDSESYKIDEIDFRIDQMNERGGDKDEKSLNNLLLNYTSPNCENGEVVERDWRDFLKGGGEGSGNSLHGGEGSGNGKFTWGSTEIGSEIVLMNFKMNSQIYRGLSESPDLIERLFGFRSKWKDILAGEQPVPLNVARSQCK